MDHTVNGPPLHSTTLGLGELQCASTVRILVMDDEDSTCRLVQAALAHKDFHIDTVSEPGDMETRLRAQIEDGVNKNAYHLIILDYVIPSLEPEQGFNWIHQHQSDASVIVVTGYPSVDSALSCLRARTYDYLTKPFQIAQLREIVLRCLESKGLLRMSEDALREALGLAIRDRRKGMQMTLKQMAEKTDVSLGYLSQIELGKNSASIETLYRICLALNIRMADLFQSVQPN
jgi:DNA-binding NtrC family response regulator